MDSGCEMGMGGSGLKVWKCGCVDVQVVGKEADARTREGTGHRAGHRQDSLEKKCRKKCREESGNLGSGEEEKREIGKEGSE